MKEIHKYLIYIMINVRINYKKSMQLIAIQIWACIIYEMKINVTINYKCVSFVP